MAEVKPCLRALRAERDLPSGERGPVDLAALARLAARRLAEVVIGEGCSTATGGSLESGEEKVLKRGEIEEGKSSDWGARPGQLGAGVFEVIRTGWE